MGRLLHSGKGEPERRDPDVKPWVEALRASSYRRVDTLSPADLMALLQGELDEEPLTCDWNPEPPEGTWSNWYGDVWNDDHLPFHDDLPDYAAEVALETEAADPGPAYPPTGNSPQDAAGGREPPPPAYDGPGDHDRTGVFASWPPGTLPPPSYGGPAVGWR